MTTKAQFFFSNYTDSRDAAPKITRRLEDVIAIEGNAARFECEVTAMTEPLIEWYKDQELLVIGVKYKMLYEDGTFTLVVNNVDIDDVGQYICRATNSYGHATSSADLEIECKLN